MGHVSDSEGNGVVRVQLTKLRSQLGSLDRLADTMREDLKKVDLNASGKIGNNTGVILHHAGLLRRKNQRALYAVEALIGDLEKVCRDLDAAGRKAGYLVEVADDEGRREIDSAKSD